MPVYWFSIQYSKGRVTLWVKYLGALSSVLTNSEWRNILRWPLLISIIRYVKELRNEEAVNPYFVNHHFRHSAVCLLYFIFEEYNWTNQFGWCLMQMYHGQWCFWEHIPVLTTVWEPHKNGCTVGFIAISFSLNFNSFSIVASTFRLELSNVSTTWDLQQRW